MHNSERPSITITIRRPIDMSEISKSGYAGVFLFTRGMLGLMFFMVGWYKVFDLGAMQHAEQLFVEGYRETWIPVWMLWGLGIVIPYLELLSGALLIIGWRVRESLFVVGGILLVVTYGHLLKEPFVDISGQIFPRAIFLIVLLALPRSADRWSVEGWLSHR